jgi:hypothetical protein
MWIETGDRNPRLRDAEAATIFTVVTMASVVSVFGTSASEM